MGVGNILMGDEGIGVRVIQEMQNRSNMNNVDFFDAGTALHALLPQFEDYDRMIIIDSVKGGENPGSIYRFTLSELEKDKNSDSSGVMLSLHDVGVQESLRMARLIQKLPAEIIFIGVEPGEISLQEDLTPAVKKKMDEIIRMVELETSRA